jgi:hypothetical protein
MMNNQSKGNTMKTIALALAACLLGIGIGQVDTALASYPAPIRHHDRVDIPFWVTRPCATEDSVNCRWDAKLQGNGKGHSYIVREFPGSAHMVCVMYTHRKYARHHDYCA